MKFLLSNFKTRIKINYSSACLSLFAVLLITSPVKASNNSLVLSVSAQSPKSSRFIPVHLHLDEIHKLDDTIKLAHLSTTYNKEKKESKTIPVFITLGLLGGTAVWQKKRLDSFNKITIKYLQTLLCKIPSYQNNLRINNLEKQLNYFLTEIQQIKANNNYFLAEIQQIKDDNNCLLIKLAESTTELQQEITNNNEYLVAKLQELVKNDEQKLIEEVKAELKSKIEETTDNIIVNFNQRVDRNQDLLIEEINRIGENQDFVIEELATLSQSNQIITECKEKLDQTELRLNNLQKEIENHRNNYNYIHNTASKEIISIELNKQYEFTKISDVLRQAEQNFKILRFFDSAKDSAKRAKYTKHSEIYFAFKVIANIGEKYFAYKKQSKSMDHRLEEEFKQYGLINNYKPTENKATINQYGKERKFKHQGEIKQIFRHLTFTKDDNRSLQIYFDFNDEFKKVDIGYCGDHLHYASER